MSYPSWRIRTEDTYDSYPNHIQGSSTHRAGEGEGRKRVKRGRGVVRARTEMRCGGQHVFVVQLANTWQLG